MPGPISDSYKGPPDDAPYVPSWCYEGGPKMCPCGHHEGYHDSDGVCLFVKFDFGTDRRCGCAGLPADSFTPMEHESTSNGE